MDIAANALVAQIGRHAIEAPSVAPLAVSPAAPDELAAARFAAIMKSPEIGPVNAAQSAATSEATLLTNAPLSLGDRMLASLQGASDDFKGIWRTAESRLQSDQTLEMREMMAMQLQVTQMAVQYDLLGKVVSRSTQNLDQLVRIQ